MIYLYFIYCDNCPECKKVEKVVWATLAELGVQHHIEVFNCDTDKSVDVAIEYGVDDVPACIFLNEDKTKHKSYCGPKSCGKKEVEKAVAYLDKPDGHC